MNELVTKATTSISRAFGKAKLFTVKYSPEILIGVGTISIIGGVVLACKETLHVEEILDNDKKIKDEIEGTHTSQPVVYTEEMAKHDRIVQTTKTAVELVKLYTPSVALVTGGITCFLVAHGILHKRNLALIAAYNAVSSEFEEYRKRVAEQVGEDVESRIKSGVVKADKDDEQVKKGDEVHVGPLNTSMYAKFFDSTNSHYCKDPDYNISFLTAQERTANRTLARRGHMFLNEVYDLCGLPHTRAGAVVGWMYDPTHPDTHIDFSMLRCWKDLMSDDASRSLKPGYESAILLDFNVDGVILDMI